MRESLRAFWLALTGHAGRDAVIAADRFQSRWEQAQADRERLIVALRTAAEGQRQYEAQVGNMAAAAQVQSHREYGLVAAAYETAMEFVNGDYQPLYGLIPPDAQVQCPKCGDLFDVVKWVEEEATTVGDTVVCVMCAKAVRGDPKR